MTDIVYGIDLGTTYSAIAQINDRGLAEIINNFEGSQTTPSVVYFESPDNAIVGSEAKNVALSDPDNTAMLIKREMGTDYQVSYQDKVWTPESISALILRELVNAANNASGQDVRKVVITVPAYFGAQEREATRQAGEVADLEVVSMVTEPVAAALSLGIKGEEPETIMVYDLGGGTFDTTVMKVGSGQVDVVAVDGKRTLGGADWDDALVELAVTKFLDQQSITDEKPRHNEEFMLDVRLKAEDAKKSLTKRDETALRLSWENTRDTVTITRAEFEEATRHLVDETLHFCERALATAQGKDPALTIDRVLLVGGSSRMPMIPTALKEKFGWEAQPTDFDLAVAKGAAILGQAAELQVLSVDGMEVELGADAPSLPFIGGASSLSIFNVLARSVGLEFMNPETDTPYVSFFAHANDSLPLVPDPITALTIYERQTKVAVTLVEQAGEAESTLVEDNRELKTVDLPFAEPMPKDSQIHIAPKISSEGIVTVQAVDPASGNRVDLEASVSVLSAEQVAEATAQVAGMMLRS